MVADCIISSAGELSSSIIIFFFFSNDEFSKYQEKFLLTTISYATRWGLGFWMVEDKNKNEDKKEKKTDFLGFLDCGTKRVVAREIDLIVRLKRGAGPVSILDGKG